MRYALRGTDGEREREWRRGEASEEQGERRGELHDVELSVCTDVGRASAVVRNEIDGREKNRAKLGRHVQSALSVCGRVGIATYQPVPAVGELRSGRPGELGNKCIARRLLC